MTKVLGGFLGQLQSAVTAVADAAQTQAPEPLKPHVTQLADQFQAAISNPAVLNQLGVPAPAALPPLDSPQKVKQAYAQSAQRDLTDPKTLKQLNDELKARDPTAKPVTAAEVNELIAKTEVKPLSARDYATLKAAAGNGSRDNPATSIDGDERARLATEGPVNLARSRLRSEGSSAEPTQAQVDAAKKDLERIDPGIFQKPPKDVVYVNEKHLGGHADPRQTKVASHELLHHLLDKRGVPHRDENGKDPQHAIIGRFGWNQQPGTSGDLIPGETANWATPPGQGLPR